MPSILLDIFRWKEKRMQRHCAIVRAGAVFGGKNFISCIRFYFEQSDNSSCSAARLR
ncbi:MAG: hypothetical protein GF333_04260 [Candidatus Omnitrophica bacterium]|nr:hypothetical protein [Candidatus Omnitrophota bacterium]